LSVVVLSVDILSADISGTRPASVYMRGCRRICAYCQLVSVEAGTER
jgi:hypothetical protein